MSAPIIVMFITLIHIITLLMNMEEWAYYHYVNYIITNDYTAGRNG